MPFCSIGSDGMIEASGLIRYDDLAKEATLNTVICKECPQT
jgi:hypothetical protein